MMMMMISMHYLVEIIGEDGRTDWQLFEEKKLAQDRYFPAFAAVSQNSPVQAQDGGFVGLAGCFLYEVLTDQMSAAKTLVRENEARRVQSSDDSMCGEPIVIEGLFKVIH
jgi:hypothetical protein